MVGRHPVHSRDHAGRGSVSGAVEHADRVQLYLLCHTIVRAAEGASDVRAVSVAVVGASSIVDRAEHSGRATAELGVRGANARVEDVRVHAAAGHAVCCTCCPAAATSDRGGPAPRRTALRRRRSRHLIGLDTRDVGMIAQRRDLRCRQSGGESVNAVNVGELELAIVRRHHCTGACARVRHVVAKHHDVVVRPRNAGVGAQHAARRNGRTIVRRRGRDGLRAGCAQGQRAERRHRTIVHVNSCRERGADGQNATRWEGEGQRPYGNHDETAVTRVTPIAISHRMKRTHHSLVAVRRRVQLGDLYALVVTMRDVDRARSEEVRRSPC